MIDSKSNHIYKELKSLRTKHTRDKAGLFFAEGEKLIRCVPENIIEYIVFSESCGDALKKSLSRSSLPQFVLSDRLFKDVSDTVTPQGALCVCRQFRTKIEKAFEKKPEFIILCENLQDPGNLGTIIRTADAAGAGGVILTKGCVDIFSPKVIRSSMGSVFNIPIVTDADTQSVIEILKKNKIQILAAHLKGSLTPYEADAKKPTAILIGNEARGLDESTAEKADLLIKLPMLGGAESLNASVAGGILIYDIVRQRYGKGGL